MWCAGHLGAFIFYILSFQKHPVKLGDNVPFLEIRVLNLPGGWGGAWVQILTIPQKTFFQSQVETLGSYKSWIYVRGRNDAINGNMKHFLVTGLRLYHPHLSEFPWQTLYFRSCFLPNWNLMLDFNPRREHILIGSVLTVKSNWNYYSYIKPPSLFNYAKGKKWFLEIDFIKKWNGGNDLINCQHEIRIILEQVQSKISMRAVHL